GKTLYTGDVYDNAINYRSLVHSTLADLEAAFAETPRIFYTDTDSAFVYEQAGVIVTTSCRVLVDTWEKPGNGAGDGTMYLMPDETMPVPGVVPPSVVPPQVLTLEPASLLMPAVAGGQPALRSLSQQPQQAPSHAMQRTAGGGALAVVPMAWYVADGAGNAQYGDDSAGSGAGLTNTPSASSAPSGGTTDGTASAAPEISVVLPEPDEKRPDFVQKSDTLYFEIDKNVWQSEAELDRSKVQIQKITVFASDQSGPPKGAVEFPDNIPPSMEDCVAIDFIRQLVPTAFSQVMFEMDNQNHLFVKLSNINFAAAIRGRSYLSDDLTYRYCYSANGDAPLFFSLER
ncbi:MAG: hypothetical protein RR320_05240, partial [Oscillospiraceae bacterium]